jgi:hypothetical protein
MIKEEVTISYEICYLIFDIPCPEWLVTYSARKELFVVAALADCYS